MGATSIHVQAVKPGSEIHNFREKELDYVRPELTVYRGLAELVKAEIIARGINENLWFINPLIVFNGDRVSFTKTYVRKKSLSTKKKAEEDERQLSLGFSSE
ncbi:hypothetical protein F3F35_31800 [Bacteroides ovatus]|nr:hypothetical protein F3F35_31800 [Bacteroides ovatus]